MKFDYVVPFTAIVYMIGSLFYLLVQPDTKTAFDLALRNIILVGVIILIIFSYVLVGIIGFRKGLQHGKTLKRKL